MHRHHDDVHDAGLADDCDACAELAQHPLRDGDREMVRQWLELAVQRPRRIPAGHNQAVAVANVLNALEHAGQIAEADSQLFFTYLSERWRVPVEPA